MAKVEFLLNSLFEDKRRANSIFMDTRMVRTTEAFLFCDKLYRNLGLEEDAIVGLQIAHRGLRGRTLTTANPNRDIFPETSEEDVF